MGGKAGWRGRYAVKKADSKEEYLQSDFLRTQKEKRNTQHLQIIEGGKCRRNGVIRRGEGTGGKGKRKGGKENGENIMKKKKEEERKAS